MDFKKNDFEVLHFPVIRGGQRKELEGCVLSITRTMGKGQYGCIYFSPEITKTLVERMLTHVQIHIEKYTGTAFLVFLRGDSHDAPLRFIEQNGRPVVRLHNKQLIDYLLTKAGKATTEPVRAYKIALSNNLSNTEEYATYKLNF